MIVTSSCVGLEQVAEEPVARAGDRPVDRAHAVGRQPDPVADPHLADVGLGVAHRLGHLAGHDVARRGTHRRRVHRGRRVGVVLEQRGEALDDRVRGHDGHGLGRRGRSPARPPVGCSCCSARARPGPSRWRSTAATRSAVDGFIDWPPATRTRTPRERKMRPTPSPTTTATTDVVGRLVRFGVGLHGTALAHPAFLDDLFGEVGDADVAGPSGVERRFDGRADVVGVDVAVVEAVAADDDDGVADPGPDLAKGVHPGVVGVEEVHHLVAQVGDRRFADLGLFVHVHGRSSRPTARSGSGSSATTLHSASKSNSSPVPPESTTPACFKTGKLLGREGQRVLRAVARRAHEFDQRLAVRAGPLGGRARDREHGALDDAHHRLAREDVGVLEATRPTGRPTRRPSAGTSPPGRAASGRG